ETPCCADAQTPSAVRRVRAENDQKPGLLSYPKQRRTGDLLQPARGGKRFVQFLVGRLRQNAAVDVYSGLLFLAAILLLYPPARHRISFYVYVLVFDTKTAQVFEGALSHGAPIS